MKTKILITLCFALSFCVEVYAEGEQEVKRGLFPFMAFIYYPDETVVDGTGARFLRGAVLIRPDWLVTSAIGPSILTNGPKGFPRKTLLARVGAVTIDSNFTLNEDEDEQEREIIQIVRPYNHSATQWWHTDISLLKALLPFNMTSAVYVTTLNHRLEYVEKTCNILVYAKKYGNWTEEKNLMQLTVELLPPSVANCGHHFLEDTMACAADSDENKFAVYDPNFCQGNSGGPLICEGEVMGLQTYIDNDCKQPHLYQALSAWDNFISCGTEDKCEEEQCSKICDVANKDPPTISISKTEAINDASMITTTPVSEIPTTIDTTYETTSDSIVEVKSQTPTATLEYQTTLIQTSSDQIIVEHTDPTTPEQTTLDQTTVEQTTSDQRIMTERQITYQSSTSVKEEVIETRTWPKERKTLKQELENSDRKTKVEAQHHDGKLKKVRSFGRTNVLNHSFFFGYFILACMI